MSKFGGKKELGRDALIELQSFSFNQGQNESLFIMIFQFFDCPTPVLYY